MANHSNPSTENYVEEILDFFHYNHAGSVNPAGDEAVESLPYFVSSLVSHHLAKGFSVPSFYSDEGDVAFNYSMIDGKILYVYLELPKLLGYGHVYNQGNKEAELELGGTKNEDSFWEGLEKLLDMVI